MDNNSITANIKCIREELNQTQEQMGIRVGLSRVAYNHLETGKTRIIPDALYRMAQSVGITPEELLTGYRPPEELMAEMEEQRISYSHRTERLEDVLRAKEAEIQLLREQIESLKETLRTKEEIISLLKKNDVSSQHDA